MADTITRKTSDERPDFSIDIGCHLENALAIANLVETVCGTSTDGSDSRIDELENNTLRAAMFCIRRELDAADDLLMKEMQL